ncbi:formyltransferase family protein [Pseudoalteromonas rubra]|uniref:phosphoribosylglycinamide formyltransferase 1 n=1 Tax=Pseudoalteromonas rubra TaxID=43658 RepID=A0A0U3I6R5_9GAMM|nr:formyltransferase family protein [Pseudoalteromonas rubra]ALU43408.1 N(5)-hydroxyornithine transformylase PvdF [Pseudoalteromonas rubra]
MKTLNLVYICSLRNAAADQAGRMVEYKGEQRYMMSPLEHLVNELNTTSLGQQYALKAVIFDDDLSHAPDHRKLEGYGLNRSDASGPWIYPQSLEVKGQLVDELLINIPSEYRKTPMKSPQRISGKSDFEARLEAQLDTLQADVILLDGLILILDDLASVDSKYHKKIVNIHPGITRPDSPYQRRGATATLDALYGARGQKVINWTTRETERAPVIDKTGASFHYIDQGIDSGPVITDVMDTHINPDDTIIEMRWNNFQQSLFPAMINGLKILAEQRLPKPLLT